MTVQGRRPRELDGPVSDNAGGGGADMAPPAASVLSIIWQQRWVVLACCVLAICVGIAYQMRATPIYASSSVVYVQQSGPKIMSDVMATGQRSNGYIVTQCQVITSTAILRGALDKPGMSSVAALANATNPVGTLKYMVRADPDKVGDLMTVTAESPVKKDAATVANAVVESYHDYQLSQHKGTAVEILRILQKEVDRYEAALKTTKEGMLKLTRENPDLTFATERSTPAVARMSSIAETLNKEQLRLLDLRTAQVEANAVKEDPYRLKRVLDQFGLTPENSPAVDPGLLSEYRAERLRLEDLTARLGPNHDSVRQAQRQFARIEGEVNDATRGSAASLLSLLEQAIASSDARVAELQKSGVSVRTSAVDLNIKQIEYEQLSQEGERIERSLEMLDGRMKDINVTEDAGAMNMTVLEVAAEPTFPVRPTAIKTLALSLIGGLMLGVGLAMLRDTLDHRLRGIDQIVAAIDVPMLGSIPHMAGRAAGADRGRFIHLLPRSPVAEAFRTLRTAIYFGIPDGSPGKVILVTSPAPGDGKSTTASNIAIAFAQAGRRVLLIDADCRRPTQFRAHGLPTAPGLSNVLAGKMRVADAIKPTTIPQLDLLVSGEIPTNPAELLDSPAFGELLQEVGKSYDQVIVDSPPIVPVTDARIIAAIADVVVLVLRAERSTRRMAIHAREALASVNARVIGFVVSDVPRGNQRYGYGYYGAGRYGYSSVQVDVGAPESAGDAPVTAIASSRSGTTNGSANGSGSSHTAVAPPTAAKPAPAKPVATAPRERVAGEVVAEAPPMRLPPRPKL